MLAFSEMDKHVSIHDQLKEGGGPVILINVSTVEPEEADQLVAAWVDDAAYMKRQPGFISTQLHRGIAGSGAFLNYAVWESVDYFRRAFENPEFHAKLDHYPASAAASPHLFRKVAVPGICVAKLGRANRDIEDVRSKSSTRAKLVRRITKNGHCDRYVQRS